MTEEEFINSIDCKFPYYDKSAWTKIVEQGCKLSSNSAFAVLHEICRPPFGEQITPAQLMEIANYWQQHFTHPLVPIVFNAACKMIKDQELPVEDVIEAMKKIAIHQNEYCALAILYFSCNDAEGKLEEVCETITSNWSSHSQQRN
jgi:hypothetical protein